MATKTHTELAIELRDTLGRACQLLTELDTGTTDTESELLYRWLQTVADVQFEMTDHDCLDRIVDRQVVIDAGNE